VSPIVIVALLALALSLLARRRQARARLSLDDVVIALAIQLGLVGAIATGLAWAGSFSPLPLAGACMVLALACWPWTDLGVRRDQDPLSERARAWSKAGVHTLILLAIVAAGVGLRLPSISAPLAGRDQGTYQLRAAATVRTGALAWTDETLATAGRELDSGDPGPVDLLGLYPSSDEPWRARHYEAAYRPGAYLGERAAGRVVPQFFHVHPMLLAVAELGFGQQGLALTWASGLWLLALACVARRLWPRGPWAALGLILVAGSPLAIWTGRTPLSETPMAALEWTAALLALRLAALVDEHERGSSEAWWLAGALALAAGVRGNALLLLPIVLALAWLRPRERGSAAAYLILAGLVTSVIVHGLTSYPYVHDELLRRLPGVGLGPTSLIAIALLGALAWIVVDRELGPSVAKLAAPLLALLPRVYGLVLLGAFALWWSLRSAAPPNHAPWARLDAAPILLGLPLLIAAGIGTVVVARRWRPQPRETWALALAALVPCTALLYAPRELPTLGFYYYGRYLVPELLPAAALLATAGLEATVSALAGPRSSSRARRVLAHALGLLVGAGLIVSVVGPLVRYPQLRLREYAAAGEVVTWLDQRLPAGAVVIAGGEGWHNGHTHNQVGGALAMAHGVEVLPYRTREDAYLSAWELLVAGPERRGQAPPPVYLLVNEAAHPYTRADGVRIALIDDQLWPPFVVEEAGLVELFVHALTPVPDQLPTRVARHELRMALLRIAVDPVALARITRVGFDPAPPGVRVDGGLGADGRACVAPKQTLRIEIPRPADARHLVITTVDTDPRRVPDWSVDIDGQRVAVEPPRGLRPHPRASLGPLPIPNPSDPDAPLVVELRPPALSPSLTKADGDPCRFGRVAELRVLGRERGGLTHLDPDAVELVTITPSEDFGQPLVASAWVAGRSLSRYRPGTNTGAGRAPNISGLALTLAAGDVLGFAPIDLPVDAVGRPRPVDLLITLANTRTPEGAELIVFADAEEIGVIAAPAQRKGSWISPPLRWQPTSDRASLRVELRAGEDEVELRDLALFTID
jgi:hypothetical protein